MTMNIVFDHVKFDVDPFKIMNDEKILSNVTYSILKCAFASGGYVAGGFAHILCRGLFCDTHENKFDQIMNYLGTSRDIDHARPFSVAGHGDIDVFFPDENSLLDFWRGYHTLSHVGNVTNLPTISGAAVELVVNKSQRIQIITKYLSPIEEQMRGFDIFNGMIAINDSECVIPEGWTELNRKGILHVVNWESPFTIKRITKWVRNHKISSFSPETAKELTNKSLELITKFKAQPLTSLNGLPPLTHFDIMKKLKSMLHMLSSDDLLLLTSVYPVDEYNGAFSHLRQRAKI
jgi:hypothetical protein